MDVFNYETANKFLKNRDRKKLKNNTWLERFNTRQIVIVYHKTIIIHYFKNGTIKLNTDGYETYSTKGRLNSYQNRGMVYQDKFEWFFNSWNKEDEPVPFEDGMLV